VASPIPSGQRPNGTGGSPVLPILISEPPFPNASLDYTDAGGAIIRGDAGGSARMNRKHGRKLRTLRETLQAFGIETLSANEKCHYSRTDPFTKISILKVGRFDVGCFAFNLNSDLESSGELLLEQIFKFCATH
jgi:hypothetical protein